MPRRSARRRSGRAAGQPAGRADPLPQGWQAVGRQYSIEAAAARHRRHPQEHPVPRFQRRRRARRHHLHHHRDRKTERPGSRGLQRHEMALAKLADGAKVRPVQRRYRPEVEPLFTGARNPPRRVHAATPSVRAAVPGDRADSPGPPYRPQEWQSGRTSRPRHRGPDAHDAPQARAPASGAAAARPHSPSRAESPPACRRANRRAPHMSGHLSRYQGSHLA